MKMRFGLMLGFALIAGCNMMPMPENEVEVTKRDDGSFRGHSGAGWTVEELSQNSFSMICEDGMGITNMLAAQTYVGDIVFTGWCTH